MSWESFFVINYTANTSFDMETISLLSLQKNCLVCSFLVFSIYNNDEKIKKG